MFVFLVSYTSRTAVQQNPAGTVWWNSTLYC